MLRNVVRAQKRMLGSENRRHHFVVRITSTHGGLCWWLNTKKNLTGLEEILAHRRCLMYISSFLPGVYGLNGGVSSCLNFTASRLGRWVIITCILEVTEFQVINTVPLIKWEQSQSSTYSVLVLSWVISTQTVKKQSPCAWLSHDCCIHHRKHNLMACILIPSH